MNVNFWIWLLTMGLLGISILIPILAILRQNIPTQEQLDAIFPPIPATLTPDLLLLLVKKGDRSVYPHVTKIDFSGGAATDDLIQKLYDHRAQFPNAKEIDISGALPGALSPKSFDLINKIPSITKMTANNVSVNKLTHDDFVDLKQLNTNPWPLFTGDTLDWSNTPADDDDIKHLVALSDRFPNVIHILLVNTKVTETSVNTLSFFPHLSDINFRLTLFPSLSLDNFNLLTLQTSDRWPTITAPNLEWGNRSDVTDETIQKLIDLKNFFPSLTAPNFSYTNVTADVLGNMKNLPIKSLDLSGNTVFSAATVTNFDDVPNTVETLKLNDIGGTNQTIINLNNSTNAQLKALFFDSNMITVLGSDPVTLKNFSSLETLSINLNKSDWNLVSNPFSVVSDLTDNTLLSKITNLTLGAAPGKTATLFGNVFNNLKFSLPFSLTLNRANVLSGFLKGAIFKNVPTINSQSTTWQANSFSGGQYSTTAFFNSISDTFKANSLSGFVDTSGIISNITGANTEASSFSTTFDTGDIFTFKNTNFVPSSFANAIIQTGGKATIGAGSTLQNDTFAATLLYGGGQLFIQDGAIVTPNALRGLTVDKGCNMQLNGAILSDNALGGFTVVGSVLGFENMTFPKAAFITTTGIPTGFLGTPSVTFKNCIFFPFTDILYTYITLANSLFDFLATEGFSDFSSKARSDLQSFFYSDFGSDAFSCEHDFNSDFTPKVEKLLFSDLKFSNYSDRYSDFNSFRSDFFADVEGFFAMLCPTGAVNNGTFKGMNFVGGGLLEVLGTPLPKHVFEGTVFDNGLQFTFVGLSDKRTVPDQAFRKAIIKNDCTFNFIGAQFQDSPFKDAEVYQGAHFNLAQCTGPSTATIFKGMVNKDLTVITDAAKRKNVKFNLGGYIEPIPMPTSDMSSSDSMGGSICDTFQNPDSNKTLWCTM